MAEQDDPINGIEQELDGDEELSVAPPNLDKKVDGPEEEERRDDEFSDEDREQRITLYNLFIPNEGVKPILKDGVTPNPAYRKINLDREGALKYHDLLRAAVLERRRHRVCDIPWKRREKMVPKDEPWKRYLGFSFNNKVPSISCETAECLAFCKNPETGVPYAMCSKKTTFEDGEALVEPLEECKITLVSADGKQKVEASGECPMGRWINTLPDDVKEKYEKYLKLKTEDNDAPLCQKQLVLYLWSLDLGVPFRVIFKSTAQSAAETALAACATGYGSTLRKLDFWKFVMHITVFDGGNFVRPHITNTGERTNEDEMKPVIDWWKHQARGILVRDLVDAVIAQKKKAEKAKEDAQDVPF